MIYLGITETVKENLTTFFLYIIFLIYRTLLLFKSTTTHYSAIEHHGGSIPLSTYNPTTKK